MRSSGAMAQTPHDALFKATFSQPEHAAGLLAGLLAPEVAGRIDWSTLCRLPGSFVDAQLAQRHSDLLFSVRLTGGRTALLYLVEHQSEPDPWMALRLFGYIDRIWQGWRKDHPDNDRLPAVVPATRPREPRPGGGSTALDRHVAAGAGRARRT
jgi:predicted transposase/invertase (TIGR01784 family)